MDIISTIGSFWTAITKLKDRQMVPLQPNRVFTIDVFQKRTIFFLRALCWRAGHASNSPPSIWCNRCKSHWTKWKGVFLYQWKSTAQIRCNCPIWTGTYAFHMCNVLTSTIDTSLMKLNYEVFLEHFCLQVFQISCAHCILYYNLAQDCHFFNMYISAIWLWWRWW